MNSIVIFYSRAGYNYVNGEIKNLEIGNTEVIARKIAELTNSQLFKIEQVHPYSDDYSECIDEAKRDQRLEVRPEIKEFPNNLKDYDIIYLGFPNFWGTMPMSMFTQLEKLDFTGKVIKVFTTHEGSGLGTVVSDVKKICKGATVLDSLAIQGSMVYEAKGKVQNWIK